MLDEEIRFELERLNREHLWLKHASAKYPDLCAFEYGTKKLYCSPSVNTEVDGWESTNLIDEGLYHDVVMEANYALTCFKVEDGGRVHSWPPIFVVGRIQRSGPGNFQHLLYEHWRRQLEDAGIAAALVDEIEDAQANRPVETEPRSLTEGDPHYAVYTTEDENGENVGVLRMHERVQLIRRLENHLRASSGARNRLLLSRRRLYGEQRSRGASICRRDRRLHARAGTGQPSGRVEGES